MITMKHCPNCGNEINDLDVEFCTECGHNLSGNFQKIDDNSIGFFDGLSLKTSLPILIFSFVIFGVFLFIGSIFWSSFMANGSIDFITYIILTVVFSVFFGGVFIGYCGCKDESYIIPNFSVYLGSIFAVVLCVIGFIFTFLIGIISVVMSALSSFGSGSSLSGVQQPTVPNLTPNIDFSFIFKIILFILLIPVASYIGIYLGYLLKDI